MCSSSLILDIVGIFIALLALALTIIISRLQIKQDKITAHNSVRPYADFIFMQSNTQMYVKLANYGVGPMIVRSLIITMDGKPIDDIISCFGSRNIRLPRMTEYYSYLYGHIKSGEKAFSPDYEYTLFSLTLRKKEKKIKDDKFRALVAEITDTLRRIHIKVVYEDIYGNIFENERHLYRFFNERYKEFLPVSRFGAEKYNRCEVDTARSS